MWRSRNVSPLIHCDPPTPGTHYLRNSFFPSSGWAIFCSRPCLWQKARLSCDNRNLTRHRSKLLVSVQHGGRVHALILPPVCFGNQTLTWSCSDSLRPIGSGRPGGQIWLPLILVNQLIHVNTWIAAYNAICVVFRNNTLSSQDWCCYTLLSRIWVFETNIFTKTVTELWWKHFKRQDCGSKKTIPKITMCISPALLNGFCGLIL